MSGHVSGYVSRSCDWSRNYDITIGIQPKLKKKLLNLKFFQENLLPLQDILLYSVSMILITLLPPTSLLLLLCLSDSLWP